MSDPFERAAASAPPTLGEGCLRRFDPEQMGDDLGTEFSDAAALWAEWQRSAEGEQDHRSQDSTAAAALG
ncbi:hypothetical protein [Pseudomonas sp. RL]|uniref:hypothetical protein n=1 Tax=Pseudomonas sp. RL TaxID=1452718 RepID=UPI00055BFA00|nr:hypothetical protein [Pseudomonas sp. RL]